MRYLQHRRLQHEIGESLESVSSSAQTVDGACDNQHPDQYEYERPNIGRNVLASELG
jgi:hypothetical protein